jgi:hypothetical protein
MMDVPKFIAQLGGEALVALLTLGDLSETCFVRQH